MPDQPSAPVGDPVPGGPVTDPLADPGPPPTSGSGWFSPLRIGIAVVLVAAALIAWKSTGNSAPAYRTAVVGTGTVESTLDSVGTITPVNQAELNFNVSGIVSTVNATVGQTVTAGQTLASLDIADLNAAVVSAQASLAQAQATLASAEASQTETTASTTTGSGASSASDASTTTTTTPSSGAGSSAGDSQQISQLQAALVAAQTTEDTDSTQAAASLAQATALCGTSTTAPTSTTSTTTTTSTTSTTTPAPTTSGSGGTTPTTCAEALSQASAAQAKVAADIKSVSAAEHALTAALEAALGSGSGPSSGGSGTSPGRTGATSTGATSSTTTGTGTSGSSSGAGGFSGSTAKTAKVATAQQLAVDQASIDTAQANVDDAEQSLLGVNLVSTITGTVASVTIAPGDSVTAGSTSGTAQIVVIGSGTSYDLSTAIDVTDIAELAVGQQAVVTPDATNSTIDGTVTSIGVLGTTSSTTTTYPVTISLVSSDLGQLSGADADVSIVTKRSVDVTTVPSSAVRTVGSTHLVTVVDAGTAKSVRVTLGTVGDLLTQVTSGVSVGQSVALADLNEPLPSTSTDTTTRGGLGGAAGLGGAGFGGGGAGFGGGGGRFGG